MRALVVYESMYGNTHAVASCIAVGLRPTMDTTVVPVGEATEERLAQADLVVVGGPTHAHSVTSRFSRKAAKEAAAKPESGLTLDAAVEGIGLRQWFHTIRHQDGKAAAAFDTRMDAPLLMTGRASQGIARRLRHRGFRVAADPESFRINTHNRLLEGEAERAAAWGVMLASVVAAHRVPG